MKKLLVGLMAMLLSMQASYGEEYSGLPSGAKIVETQSLEKQGYPDRVLALWMLKPSDNPREASEPYTCPEETRGSYYSGPTRVSLFDKKGQKLINTIDVAQEFEGGDTFDIPYRIHAGSYYHVAGTQTGREGKPTIMWLRDYNGDGDALEFALFDAQACMGLGTALFGYSPEKDKVIQYQITLKSMIQDQESIVVSKWVDYLFSKSPMEPGFWKYEIDYRGRGGTLDKYEVRYNRNLEGFEAALVSSMDEEH